MVVSSSTIPTAGIESEEEAMDNDVDYMPPDPHQKKLPEELVLHLKQPEWMDAVFAAVEVPTDPPLGVDRGLKLHSALFI